MVRKDSAFYMDERVTKPENRLNPVLYAFRAKGTKKLNQCCLDFYYASHHQEDRFYTPFHPYYGEILYRFTNSKPWRRVCFRICFVEEQIKNKKTKEIMTVLSPAGFAVMINMNEQLSARDVIDFYCQRGNSENFTKDLKDDFYARTLSPLQFEANAFAFLLKTLAYNLLKVFQYRGMEENGI